MWVSPSWRRVLSEVPHTSSEGPLLTKAQFSKLESMIFIKTRHKPEIFRRLLPLAIFVSSVFLVSPDRDASDANDSTLFRENCKSAQPIAREHHQSFVTFCDRKLSMSNRSRA